MVKKKVRKKMTHRKQIKQHKKARHKEKKIEMKFKLEKYKRKKPLYEEMTEEGLAGDVADAEYEGDEEREAML